MFNPNTLKVRPSGGYEVIRESVPEKEKEISEFGRFAYIPKIAVIGDRESANLQGISSYGYRYKCFHLTHVVLPGREIDFEVAKVFDRMIELNNKTRHHHDKPGYFPALPQKFTISHAIYDKTRLKEPGYRREYCEELLTQLEKTNPDIIVLANFKIVLDDIFARTFAGRIINLHPSVLPLLKGFRPEHRAGNLAEFPEACGYTIHNVSPALDGGATYFQQRVAIEPYDAEQEQMLGKQEYQQAREDRLRLKIIRAQSCWLPAVVHLVMSDTPKAIVEDAEAFTAEGRPGFEKSADYARYLQGEFEEWRKHHPAAEHVGFNEWSELHRQPYQRVLFDIGLGFQTVEKILGAPQIAPDEPGLMSRTRYSFTLEGDQMPFFELISLAEGKNRNKLYSTSLVRDPGSSISRCEIETACDLSPHLRKRGIEFKSEPLLVRVTAPRIPIPAGLPLRTPRYERIRVA